MNNAITINGRGFTVEAIDLGADLAAKGRRVYGLTGVKGAQYAAVQYINEPDFFHIIGIHSFNSVRFFDGIVLTDTDGSLKVRA